MHSRVLLALATALLVLFATGCGDEVGGAIDPVTEPTTPSAPAEPSTVPPTKPPTGAITPPSGALQKIRVIGDVVEVGDCVVVRDDNDTTWTIAGDLASDLVVGDRVQVTGAPDLVALGCGGPVVKASVVTVLG